MEPIEREKFDSGETSAASWRELESFRERKILSLSFPESCEQKGHFRGVIIDLFRSIEIKLPVNKSRPRMSA